MRKRSILKQSKCHSVATNYYINDSAAGIYIWPYTQEGNHVIDPDTQMDTFYPDNPGLDLVDPTQTQGVRTLTDLYLQAKFKPDLNSADVHCIGLLIKYNDHMGSTPFASQTWTGLYIDSDPTLATTKLIYSGPSFATESSVIAVVNFGTDNDTVQTSYIPGPISLEYLTFL